MIRITNEKYTGGASSDAECTFASVAEAEARLSEVFEEDITLADDDYEESGHKCACGGIMHHSEDMDDPGEGEPFWQCEMCGKIEDAE